MTENTPLTLPDTPPATVVGPPVPHNGSCDACGHGIAASLCVECNFYLCLNDSTKHSAAIRSHTLVSLTPSQVDDAAQHNLIDGSIDPMKQSPSPSLSSPPADSLITIDGPLVHQMMDGGGDVLITTHPVVQQQTPITHQIIQENPAEKKGEKGGGGLKKAAARRGRPKKSLDDDKSSDGDDSVAPHEEETFINFVKKFEMKQNGEDDTDEEEETDDADKTPKKGRGGRVIKKRKIDNGESSDDESQSIYVSWEQNFAKLVKYKSEYGDCCVPGDWNEDPAFARWANRLKQMKSKGKIKPDRIKRLEELGFVWNTATSAAGLAALWDRRFAEVQQFKKVHNHCNVPYRWEENKPLANWVFRQREHRKAGKLTTEREKKLTTIGFVWGSTAAVSKDDRWDQRIHELADYRKANSHCCVPNVYPKNQKLANWVRKQRELKKKGKLSPVRLAQLTDMGFAWEMGDKSRITTPLSGSPASNLPLSPTTFPLSTASPSTSNNAAFLSGSSPSNMAVIQMQNVNNISTLQNLGAIPNLSNISNMPNMAPPSPIQNPAPLLYYPTSPNNPPVPVPLHHHFPNFTGAVHTIPPTIPQTQPLLAIPYPVNTE